ncbi:MAG: hypothetical protein ACLUMK_10725 [Christensenellales bacterium]
MRSENVFVEIAHPIWSRMEPEELRALQGFNAIEILTPALNVFVMQAMPSLLGYAPARRTACNRHCLRRHPRKTAKSDRFSAGNGSRRGAHARSRFTRSMCGRFYASQGPAFSECYVEDDHLHIECTPVRKSTYHLSPRGKAVYALDKPLTELDSP